MLLEPCICTCGYCFSHTYVGAEFECVHVCASCHKWVLCMTHVDTMFVCLSRIWILCCWSRIWIHMNTVWIARILCEFEYTKSSSCMWTWRQKNWFVFICADKIPFPRFHVLDVLPAKIQKRSSSFASCCFWYIACRFSCIPGIWLAVAHQVVQHQIVLLSTTSSISKTSNTSNHDRRASTSSPGVVSTTLHYSVHLVAEMHTREIFVQCASSIRSTDEVQHAKTQQLWNCESLRKVHVRVLHQCCCASVINLNTCQMSTPTSTERFVANATLHRSNLK